MLLEKQEDMWYQRARTNWLVNGDKNTKFFHSQASVKRRKNLITGIHNNQGVWKTSKEAIKNILLEHFTKLYTSQRV